MNKTPWLPPKPKNARKCKCKNGQTLQWVILNGLFTTIMADCPKCGGTGFFN